MADYRWAEDDNWASAWDPLIAEVGRDFEIDVVHWAADPIEASAVRRYLEPLEFDCPLHYNIDVAREHGYANIVAPYSGLTTWLSEGLWKPGDPPFWTDPSRNVQPGLARFSFVDLAPPTNGLFQTDLEHEFMRPVEVGDRLGATGKVLLSCSPKQTSVGRGAFVHWETRVVDEHHDLVALMRRTAYYFVAMKPQ